MAPPKRAAGKGNTPRSASPSRRGRCPASGRLRVRLVTGQFFSFKDTLFENQLERIPYAKAGDLCVDMPQAATARGRGQVDVRPGNILRDEAAQEARGEDVIALAVHGALHDIGD